MMMKKEGGGEEPLGLLRSQTLRKQKEIHVSYLILITRLIIRTR